LSVGQAKKASYVAVLGNTSLDPAISATVVPGVNPGISAGILSFQPWPLGGEHC
jgi:hypothetical protein